MNIKPKTAVLAILTLSTIGLATAKAPDIDPARIDSMVAEVLRQADQHPNQTAKTVVCRRLGYGDFLTHFVQDLRPFFQTAFIFLMASMISCAPDSSSVPFFRSRSK